MTVAAGTKLGPYEILSALGAGGMGEVYRATDTKLGRAVAIKVLPEQFAHDAERMERFRREAQMLASLNHPNIASIYGLEEADGTRALVMELVEGPTLAERIARGPISLEEVLPIARQMTEALEYAHEHGIIHRDLKPANVKVTPDGHVKVLDFGLAKALEGDSSVSDPSTSPTLTAAATQAGVILGTAAYMSPEQAKGATVDRRTDVWSFGVVVYEMLTGKQMFAGESVTDSLAAVLKTDPDWSALQPGTPLAIRRLLRSCLERDRRHRLQAIGDARVIIEDTLDDKADEESLSAGPATFSRVHWIIAAVAGVLLLAGGVITGLRLGTSGAEPELPWRTFTIAITRPPGEPTISPDGHHVAYTTATTHALQRELWVQDLSQTTPRGVVVTTNLLFGPFWSPDSEYVGYVEQSDLKKVSRLGGPSQTMGRLPGSTFAGAAWSPDGGSIVFSSGTPARLYEMPAAGGAAKVLFKPDESEAGFYLVDPHFLSGPAGTRHLLYSRGSSPTEGQIVLRDLANGRTQVLAAGLRPVYSPTGHVIFEAQGGLWAVPFSLKDLRVSGEPFPLRERATDPSVAPDGTLVYLDAGARTSDQLVWKSRAGGKLGVVGQPQERINAPLLSPDGKRVAVYSLENGNQDIWIHDAVRGLKTRITSDAALEDRPIWSPDGKRIAYASNRSGNWDVFIQAADGSGRAEPLLATPQDDYLSDWSRDGKYLIFDFVTPNGRDIGYVRQGPGENPKKVVPFLASPFDEGDANLSPDGRFLAYSSNESGRFEVYVQRFPEGGGKVQVSAQGGVQPRWRGDGRELYYVEGETLLAVAVTSAPDISVGKAVRLFEQKGITRDAGQQYDVSADGQRFVVSEPIGGETSTAIRVVQNWFVEFRNRQKGRQP